MVLSCSLAVILFMAGELEVGLIAIAVAIAVGLGPIWYILHSEKKLIKDIQTQMNTRLNEIWNQVHNTNEGLQKVITSGIDEKIAVFTTYIPYIQSWTKKENGIDAIYRNYIDRIKFDMSALGKFALSMNDNQRINFHSISRRIVETLENKNYHDEAGEIKDVSIALFPSR
jgi:hypothetical protein